MARNGETHQFTNNIRKAFTKAMHLHQHKVKGWPRKPSVRVQVSLTLLGGNSTRL